MTVVIGTEILAAMDWPTSSLLTSGRLLLEPLTPEHADEMVDVLAAPALYEFIGGEAPSVEQLRERYTRQSVGRSPDGAQGWLNWIVRRADTGQAIGFTQATLERDAEVVTANIAWVIAPEHQGQGFASESAATMCAWLEESGVTRFGAYIGPQNRSSIGVARKLQLRVTNLVVDGENRWESHPDDGGDASDR